MRGGPVLTGTWQLDGIGAEPGPRNYLRLVEALLEIQHHTITRVVIPDVDVAEPHELAAISQTARLLRGQHIEVTWTRVTMTLGAPDNLPPADMPEVVLMYTRPLTVTIAGQQIEIDRHRRVFYRSARLADPASAHIAHPGDQVRFVPASTNSAVLVVVPAAES